MQEERACVRQARHVIGGRGTLGLLILEGVLNRQHDLRNNSQQDAQVIFAESVTLAVIKRQNADRAIQAHQRHRQRASHGGELGLVVQIASLLLRVAVDDLFAVLRHPSGQALSQRYLQRRE